MIWHARNIYLAMLKARNIYQQLITFKYSSLPGPFYQNNKSLKRRRKNFPPSWSTYFTWSVSITSYLLTINMPMTRLHNLSIQLSVFKIKTYLLTIPQLVNSPADRHSLHFDLFKIPSWISPFINHHISYTRQCCPVCSYSLTRPNAII